MKTSVLKYILAPLCLLLLSTQCEDDVAPLTQEEERAELNTLKSEIEDLANTSVCNETSECKFIGLGSKPCGGPWSYLIYSTSIDTENLENMVADYNQKELDFNAKWGVVSDCALTQQPSSIKCENNTCIAVF